jgi:uncharacterized protein YceK
MRRTWVVLLAAALLSGCASIMEGSTQQIAVDTTPSGAKCTFNRDGQTIATVDVTPGTVTIQKTRHDINVVCELNGYQPSDYLNESGTAGAVFGNLLIGGAIGWVADMATGSDNKYESPLNIALVAKTTMPAAPVSAPVALAMSTSSAPMPVIPASAPTVDQRTAELTAERFKVLSRLAADGLLPQEAYETWAQQNAGAFLLTTAAPPLAGLGHKISRYEELAEFLKTIQAETNLKVAAVERETLLHTIMPMDGPRAPRVKPPADLDAAVSWFAFLDKVRDEGLLPAPWIESEKAAINDARIVEGLPPVPIMTTTASN